MVERSNKTCSFCGKKISKASLEYAGKLFCKDECSESYNKRQKKIDWFKEREEYDSAFGKPMFKRD
ncbi:hypothetical protein ACFL6G_00780 [candidate division KSB1 bacterium]